MQELTQRNLQKNLKIIDINDDSKLEQSPTDEPNETSRLQTQPEEIKFVSIDEIPTKNIAHNKKDNADKTFEAKKIETKD